MRFMSGEFLGYSRRRIPLQSMNILVHVELMHGLRSCIKYIPSVGTQRVHMSFHYHELYHSGILHYPCYHSHFSEETGLCC